MAPPPPPRDESDSQRMPLIAVALARNIDFKIPLWAIFVLAASGLFALSKMYLQVEQLVVASANTNETLRIVSAQLAEITKAQALTASEMGALRDRMARIEAEHARFLSMGREK